MKDQEQHKGIGRRLRVARKGSGLSLSKIFVATEINQSAIWRMEDGRVAPGAATLIKLCQAYGCSADFILGLQAEETTTTTTTTNRD